MRMPIFSVVIPSYNQGVFIEQTLLSIINQQYPNYEIIVIDGGSSDQTVDVLHKYSSNIRYWVSEPDEGQSHAISKGFKVATGDIFCWLNSDDIYLRDTFKIVSNAFHKAGADVVYGNKVIIDADGAIVSNRILTPFLPFFLRDAYLCGGFGIYQPSAFWTRELYIKSGGVDKSLKFCMDNELFNKFVLSSAKFYFVNYELAGFRVHSLSKTSTLNCVAIEERASLYQKYVIQRGVRFPSIKRFFARLYRIGWLIAMGKLLRVLRTRYSDPLKWVP